MLNSSGSLLDSFIGIGFNMFKYKSNKAEFFWFLTGYSFIRIGFNMFEYKSNKAEFLWFLTGYSFIGIGFNMFKYKSNKAEFFWFLTGYRFIGIGFNMKMCRPRVGEANPLFSVCIALWRPTATANP